MRDHIAEFRTRGAVVLAVTMLPPELLAEFLQFETFPFDFVSDPKQHEYRRFGLERASWLTYVRPRVLFGYLKLIARGRRPRLPNAAEDVHQLGGDFVLNAAGIVTYAFRSSDPTARPPIATMLNAVDAAR